MNITFLSLVGAFLLFTHGPFTKGKKASISNRQCSTNKKYGSLKYKFFGVRTLYKNIYKLPGHKLPSATNRTNQTLGCSPIFIYMITRHGARYPRKGGYAAQQKLFENIKKINSTGKSKLCGTDLEILRQWQPWLDEYVDQNQTEYGDREIRKIIRRYVTMLPELFPANAEPRNYNFLSSDYQRTTASMKVFAEEILSRNRNKKAKVRLLSRAKLQVRSVEGDTLIRYAKTCMKFVKTVAENSTRSFEFNRFLEGPVGKRILLSVAKRLGIKKNQLSPEQIYIMYFHGCCLQQWVETVNGPWCRVFSKKDLRDLDYASDIKEYWFRSSEVSRKMSCDLATDIVATLKNAARSPREQTNYPNGKFLFGHVTTIMSLMANMQLHDMPTLPLTADNYRQHKSRQYRFSEMMPSAGNLAFILYKCEDEYKVQAFWNEKEIQLSACSDENFVGNPCSLEKFLQYFNNFDPRSDTKCSFENICSWEAGAA